MKMFGTASWLRALVKPKPPSTAAKVSLVRRTYSFSKKKFMYSGLPRMLLESQVYPKSFGEAVSAQFEKHAP